MPPLEAKSFRLKVSAAFMLTSPLCWRRMSRRHIRLMTAATTARTIIVGPTGSVPVSDRRRASSRTSTEKISSITPEAWAARVFQISARPTARKLIR
jgi:hypothetical protein